MVKCLKPSEASYVKNRNEWLGDETINSALCLMQSQFPHCRGLQLTTLGENLQFAVARFMSVQVHNVNNIHWTTSSADRHGNIFLYDNQYTRISNSLQQQLATIYRTDEKSIVVHVKPVQQQMGGSDCGLFSLAFAIDLASRSGSCNHLLQPIKDEAASCKLSS